MQEKKATYWEYGFFILVTLTLMGTWYYMWVAPNDKLRWEIIECMGPDRSEQAYNECLEIIRKK